MKIFRYFEVYNSIYNIIIYDTSFYRLLYISIAKYYVCGQMIIQERFFFGDKIFFFAGLCRNENTVDFKFSLEFSINKNFCPKYCYDKFVVEK